MPERNGYVYVLDRTTGEVLSADPFVHITSTLGVDLKTGKPKANPQKAPSLGIVTRDDGPSPPRDYASFATGELPDPYGAVNCVAHRRHR